MTKKLFVTDLDGTFLDSNSKVSEFSKNAVKEVIKAGHIFCIATGRSWSQTQEIYNGLDIDTLVITSNGTLVHSPINNGYEENYNPIGSDVANKILNHEWLRPQIVGVSAPSKDKVEFYNLSEERIKVLKYDGLERIDLDEPNVINEVSSMVILVKDDFSQEEFSKIIPTISKDVQFHRWNLANIPGFISIGINSTKSKETGVKELAKYYNIDPKDIVSFGDQLNDVTMTKFTGTGCVVKNANPILKEVADVVLEKTNDEDGVAHHMLEMIKGNN